MAAILVEQVVYELHLQLASLSAAERIVYFALEVTSVELLFSDTILRAVRGVVQPSTPVLGSVQALRVGIVVFELMKLTREIERVGSCLNSTLDSGGCGSAYRMSLCRSHAQLALWNCQTAGGRTPEHYAA